MNVQNVITLLVEGPVCLYTLCYGIWLLRRGERWAFAGMLLLSLAGLGVPLAKMLWMG